MLAEARAPPTQGWEALVGAICNPSCFAQRSDLERQHLWVQCNQLQCHSATRRAADRGDRAPRARLMCITIYPRRSPCILTSGLTKVNTPQRAATTAGCAGPGGTTAAAAVLEQLRESRPSGAQIQPVVQEPISDCAVSGWHAGWAGGGWQPSSTCKPGLHDTMALPSRASVHRLGRVRQAQSGLVVLKPP
jgi:hypothetical protein